jgi:hypothetical protein
MQQLTRQGVSPLLFAKRLPAAKENALRFTGTDTELDPKDNPTVQRENDGRKDAESTSER